MSTLRTSQQSDSIMAVCHEGMRHLGPRSHAFRYMQGNGADNMKLHDLEGMQYSQDEQ